MTTDTNSQHHQEVEDDAPPVFKTWNHVYAFVLILHALIITLFYFFTHAYA